MGSTDDAVGCVAGSPHYLHPMRKYGQYVLREACDLSAEPLSINPKSNVPPPFFGLKVHLLTLEISRSQRDRKKQKDIPALNLAATVLGSLPIHACSDADFPENSR
ncbi:hypothetical protein CISG_05426 [Coccidioides immitis RMSCC 3703]|uniref:Uncharacterized protein n=2 Tax=Coccidioides immitis TaxID=5501 RepID=A0A0J8QU02_COCIT|nr:hypothetical protein CIRG_00681 [Coccidioides immitis RMSCC 2394]KMU75941.1 hypothetical protein CISG_05426 [Coccidioides immitis RMSCC 3703]